jgi:hypothetical protein
VVLPAKGGDGQLSPPLVFCARPPGQRAAYRLSSAAAGASQPDGLLG